MVPHKKKGGLMPPCINYDTVLQKIMNAVE